MAELSVREGGRQLWHGKAGGNAAAENPQRRDGGTAEVMMEKAERDVSCRQKKEQDDARMKRERYVVANQNKY